MKLNVKDVIFISVAALVGLLVLSEAELRKTLSTPEIIVFQTGSGSIFLNMILLIFGIAGVTVVLSVLKDRDSKNNPLKLLKKNNVFFFVPFLIIEYFVPFLIIVGMVGAGALMIFVSVYVKPYSENIVIDKITGSIRIEKHYLLKNTTSSRIAFNNIENVMYYEERTYSTYGPHEMSGVKLILSDGREIKVSYGISRRGQYGIAKTISNVTSKRLVDFSLDPQSIEY